MFHPTQDHKLKQNYFINNLKTELTSFAKENILMCRNFDFYMDPKLDKMNSMSNRNDNPQL